MKFVQPTWRKQYLLERVSKYHFNSSAPTHERLVMDMFQDVLVMMPWKDAEKIAMDLIQELTEDVDERFRLVKHNGKVMMKIYFDEFYNEDFATLKGVTSND